MRYLQTRKCKRAVIFVLIVSMLSMVLAFALPDREVSAEDKYPIMGPTNVTVGQLINYYNSVTQFPAYYAGTDAPTLDAFCQMYLDECNAEGVRVEVAFCQAMDETNYLRYTGRVPIEANNFAGIGAIDSDVHAWAVFPSVREGIRAQVQHLKAYASTAPLNNPCVDPRFAYVSRGCAPYLEDLSGRWASNPSYGTDIRYGFMAKLGTFNGYCTIYNGVDYSAVYDPEYYLEHYDDVRIAFANDGYALLAHYVNNGINEGRRALEWFNPYTYKYNYVDLRNAYGYNIGDYIRHYVFAGQAEGRQGFVPNGSTDRVTVYEGVNYSSVYNYDYYLAHNPDVAEVIGVDDIDVIAHFVDHGMSEGRRGNASFDVTSYKNEYPDLRAEFRYDNKRYFEHYMYNGVYEGRHGTGCNTRQGAITREWIIDFAPVYNYDYYVEHNPDVKAAFGDDDIAVLDHFVNNGMSEGRQAADNFNVWAYASNNPDLFNVFWMELTDYYIHYIYHGQYEGRIAV